MCLYVIFLLYICICLCVCIWLFCGSCFLKNICFSSHSTELYLSTLLMSVPFFSCHPWCPHKRYKIISDSLIAYNRKGTRLLFGRNHYFYKQIPRVVNRQVFLQILNCSFFKLHCWILMAFEGVKNHFAQWESFWLWCV